MFEGDFILALQGWSHRDSVPDSIRNLDLRTSATIDQQLRDRLRLRGCSVEAKAGELLLSLLSVDEKRQFARDGYLQVDEWILSPQGVDGCCEVSTGGGDRRCIHTIGGDGHIPSRVPDVDALITYYLAIKADPRMFRHIAGGY